MILNKHELTLASGTTSSTAYVMKAEEYLAAFHVSDTVQGSLVLQSRYFDDTYMDVYDDNTLYVSYASVTSGQVHLLEPNDFLRDIRFRTTSSQTSAKTIVLITVEL